MDDALGDAGILDVEEKPILSPRSGNHFLFVCSPFPPLTDIFFLKSTKKIDRKKWTT
jgi:hypothetical protein